MAPPPRGLGARGPIFSVVDGLQDTRGEGEKRKEERTQTARGARSPGELPRVQNLGGGHEPNVSRAECQYGYRVPARGDEFDLKSLPVRITMDHGAHVAALQPVLVNVAGEDDCI
jgi:hypothetical protein